MVLDYWLQLETEWLRSNPHVAGVLAFCYLTNNYGYTGDWFVGSIKDLKPSPVLHYFEDAFAPQNVFINLADERYVKEMPAHKPGEKINFKLAGVNYVNNDANGTVEIVLFNSKGKKVFGDKKNVELPASGKIEIPYSFSLPTVPGGYLLQTSFTADGSAKANNSRRYFKVGELASYDYYNY